jgi:CHASE3 domain
MMFLKRQLAVLLVLVSSCLAGVGALAWHDLTSATKSELLQSHTEEVIDQLDGLLSSFKDADTRQRSDILTGNPSNREPYQAATVLPTNQQRMDHIRLVVAQGVVEERKLLKISTEQASANSRRALQSVLFTAALGATALLLMWLSLRAGLASRQRVHT